MKKFNIFLTSLGVLTAAAMMTFLAEKQTPPAFVGWTIFFAALFSPTMFLSQNSKFRCSFTRK